MRQVASYCARISFIPLTLLLAFSVILVSLDVLGKSTTPARQHHLGWQAWDVVRYVAKVKGDDAESGKGSGSGSFAPGEGAGKEENNTSTPLTGGIGDDFAPSLPLETWDPLLRHTTGITEITVMGCYLPPWIYPKLCTPPTTAEEDKMKGKWVRVERDLNWKTGIWFLNVYYRRTRRYDVPLITNLLLLEEGVPPPGYINLTEYQMAKGDFRDGVWPRQKKLRLWFKTKEGNSPGLTKGAGGGKKEGKIHYVRDGGGVHRKRKEAWNQWDQSEDEDEEEEEPLDPEQTGDRFIEKDDSEIITEIDVLYGDGRPFWGFERVQNGPVVNKIANKYESVDLVVRKGNPLATLAPTPRFHKSGKFKILQIADLHFSVSRGLCRDTDKSPCIGDVDTLTLIERTLDEEKPDLVVFSGDQLNGQGTSWDARSVIAKLVGPVIDRKIPWTAIFGNHDSEIAGDRALQMKQMQALPYSLAELGPSDVDGVGNYVVKLYSGDASMMHLFTLYFLDSHARQKKKYVWDQPDYDYLKQSQIDWFLNTSSSIKPIERPFTPDGADDLGSIWRKRQDKDKRRTEDKILAKPNAMMFFHIPLAESYAPVDVEPASGQVMDLGTEIAGDSPGNSQTNGGFFEKGLMQAFAMPERVLDVDTDEEHQSEVKVVGHGHCHNTDKCRRHNGIWFCFGGGGSYSGYGHLGFPRRFRVYEISKFGEEVVSWKRTDANEVIEKQVLVRDGKSANLQLVNNR